MDRVPFAASTHPGPGSGWVNPDESRNPDDPDDNWKMQRMQEVEDPLIFQLSAEDERARKERLAAPPIQKPVVTGEDRDRLVRECADAVLWQEPLIRGAGDTLIRSLSEVLNIPVDEADALIAAEIAGTQRDGRRFSAGLPRTEKTYSN